MLKRFALIAVIGMFLISCGQVSEQQTGSDVTMISELVAEPLGFDGQEVTIEGTITHICRGSGDKIRVNQLNDADFSIMVMLEDFQSQFSTDSEGYNVRVKGVVKTEVRNMDALEEDAHDCASTREAAERLQERGITPNIITYMEMTSFEMIESVEVEEVAQEEALEVAEAQAVKKCC